MDYSNQNTNNSLSDLSDEDKELFNNCLLPSEGFNVKGKVVCLDILKKLEWGAKNFPKDKSEVGFHLAIALSDEDSLAYYQKLSHERRTNLLRNCLIKTCEAYKDGRILTTPAKYFTGIVKNRTEELKRLEEYKRRHTTLYGK